MKRFALYSACALAFAGVASADVLMDQIGPDGTFTTGQPIRASQDFEAAFNQFDVVMIDDFTTVAAYNLTSFEAVVGGFNGWAGQFNTVAGWRVEIYSSPAAAGANLTGDVASVTFGNQGWSGITLGFAGANSAKLTFDMTGVSVGVGTFWIGLIPQHTFGGGGGQTGIFDSTFAGSPSNDNSVQANPGGGFGFGGFVARNTDEAYRVQGDVVPAPGAIALLGMAGLVARRRRRD